MSYTPREELERVPSFAEQERRRREDQSAGLPARARCQSCGAFIDPDVGGVPVKRHDECPPRPLPQVYLEAAERVRARGTS